MFKIKSTKLSGLIFLDFLFSISFVVMITSAVSNDGFVYEKTGSFTAILWLITSIIAYLWRFIITITPTIRSYKEKNIKTASFFTIAQAIFSFGIVPFTLTFLNSKGKIELFKIIKDDYEYVDEFAERTAKANAKVVINKILLTCASAASTGILVSKVKKAKAAKTKKIEALPYPEAIHVFNDYDVLLIAPQASFKYNDFAKKRKGSIIIKKIPADMYGRMDGEEILKFALEQ